MSTELLGAIAAVVAALIAAALSAYAAIKAASISSHTAVVVETLRGQLEQNKALIEAGRQLFTEQLCGLRLLAAGLQEVELNR